MAPRRNLGYLLHHLATVLDRQSDALLQERLSIGFSQFKILMALKWHTGVQQKQIADYLGQTEASISRQIKLLHDQHLLESKVNPKNRRERVTTLTTKGNRVADEAMQLLNDYHTPMFERLSASQQQQLTDILETMHTHACQNTKPGVYHAE